MLTPATSWALLTGLHSAPWEDLDAEDADPCEALRCSWHKHAIDPDMINMMEEGTL
jgi:hypothetical protein